MRSPIPIHPPLLTLLVLACALAGVHCVGGEVPPDSAPDGDDAAGADDDDAVDDDASGDDDAGQDDDANDDQAEDLDGDGVTATDDCHDGDPAIFPGNPETCDGRDNDCNGVIDDGLTSPVYLDRDADGYGDDADVRQVCAPPEGYSTLGGDCDDLDPDTHPAAVESCGDDADNDCDGDADGDDPDCENACSLSSCSCNGFNYSCATNSYSTNYSYNGFGQVVGISVTFSNGHQVQCSYSINGFGNCSGGSCHDDTGDSCSF